MHTTRTFSKAICVKNNVQIILFDTPGLVTDSEVKKHQLESTYTSACRHSIQHSDIIGVVHDVSNSWNRNELHKTVMNTLTAYPKLPSFLILNKIDTLKSKRVLLDLARTLTNNTLMQSKKVPSKNIVLEKPEKSVGWSNFSDVFMISSVTGDGMSAIMVSNINRGFYLSIIKRSTTADFNLIF